MTTLLDPQVRTAHDRQQDLRMAWFGRAPPPERHAVAIQPLDAGGFCSFGVTCSTEESALASHEGKACSLPPLRFITKASFAELAGVVVYQLT